MTNRCTFGLIMSMAVLIFVQSASAEDAKTVYLEGVKSTVEILMPLKDGKHLSRGSGSIVNLKEGYILTNHHVVMDGATKRAAIVFPLWEKGKPIVDSEKYEKNPEKVTFFAKVIASEEKVDLAILKIEEPNRIPKEVTAVRFANNSPLTGDKLHSIGNPGASGAMWIYTPGDVRSVYSHEFLVGGHDPKAPPLRLKSKVIEATSPISPGDSGGPCFNDNGEQIGVSESVKNSGQDKKDSGQNKVSAQDQGTVNPPKSVQPPPTDADKLEKDAASRLNLLRPLAKDPNKKVFVIDHLKKLVANFPKTEAAKEAQKLLKQLQD